MGISTLKVVPARLVKNTFEAELRNCMLIETEQTSNLDLMSSADTQTLTRNTIIAAAEAWNTQSRGHPSSIIWPFVLLNDGWMGSKACGLGAIVTHDCVTF